MKTYPSTHKQSNTRVKPQIQRLTITHLFEKQNKNRAQNISFKIKKLKKLNKKIVKKEKIFLSSSFSL